MFSLFSSRLAVKSGLKRIGSVVTMSSACSPFPATAYSVDRYKCVRVTMAKLLEWEPTLTQEKFQLLLNESLKVWKDEKLRGIWFNVLAKDSVFLPTLVENKFVYHHAKPEYVTLTKWITEDEPNNIPEYPFTNIGVGGLVVDDKDRVLVVKEKHSILNTKLWKFPGGHASQGEELGETAEREVLEETGIRTKFDSIIAIRHMHKFQFGCSDIYVVCLLKPVQDASSADELTPTRCSHEIEAVEWIPIQALISQVSDGNRFVLEKFLFCRSSGISISMEPVKSIFKGQNHAVYSLSSSSK